MHQTERFATTGNTIVSAGGGTRLSVRTDGP